MIKPLIILGMLALSLPASAQEAAPATWRDPDTRCIYFKIGDSLSLRYRRDGSPDCASVRRDIPDAITRDDIRDIGRSIEALRRELRGINGAMAEIRREIDNLRRDARQ
jgi:hypothetical protein